MKPTVTVIDYGIGNLLSVARAFEYCDAEVQLTDDPRVIAKATHLILPGVGAFADGMAGLKERNLIPAVVDYARSGKPLLGICLGMQMLLSYSEEFGQHRGLGLIPGQVTAIPATTSAGQPHKIPHIGWNELRYPSGLTSWAGTVLGGLEPGTATYFVHSYRAVPEDPQHRLADCNYNGVLISAAIRSGSVYGCQFHPEKSGPVGLKIIDRFIRLT